MVAADHVKHHIRLPDQRRLLAAADILCPELLQKGDRILLFIQIPLNLLPDEVILIIGEQAGDIGGVDVHDTHVVPHLKFVVAWHTPIGPQTLGAEVRCLTLKNGLLAIGERHEAIHVSEHEWEQWMLIHGLIPIYREPSLLGKHLRYDVFQQMPDRKGDRLIRRRNDRLHTDLVVVQLACGPIRR